MSHIKNISFFLLIASIVSVTAKYLESDFIFIYLKEDIVSLLLTLLAINTATTGLIASKMQDFLKDHPAIDFTNTLKQMKLSLLEQILLIAISIISLVILDSGKFIFSYKVFICNTVLLSVLVYAINILWDTGKSVFVIIEQIQKNNQS